MFSEVTVPVVGDRDSEASPSAEYADPVLMRAIGLFVPSREMCACCSVLVQRSQVFSRARLTQILLLLLRLTRRVFLRLRTVFQQQFGLFAALKAGMPVRGATGFIAKIVRVRKV